MKALGIHLLVEMQSCAPGKLDSVEFIEKCMLEAAEAAGAMIINSFFRKFSPCGISGVVVIAESHLSIHTWPEFQYAAVDVFTCGEKVDPWKALKYIGASLEAQSVEVTTLNRGIVNEINH
jgi:S-adenosylmethionine decarboxylase